MKPVNFPEEILDFAQSYLYSGLTLSCNWHKKPPYKTFQDHSKGYVLCSHFLTAHGVELYLKFLIKLLGDRPPSNTHNLNELTKRVNSLLPNLGYKRKLFSNEQKKLVDYLDRYEKFRYPTDLNWNLIPDIFNESTEWKKVNIKKLNKEFEGMVEKLNDWGYKITKKTNYITIKTMKV